MRLRLTRTIWVSCLSHFLLLLLHLDKFVMSGAPGLAHLHAIKFLHLDKFLAQRQLVPRHCAGTRLPASCNRDSFSVTYQNCTAIAPAHNQFCTMTAKSAPYPPCTVTVFRLKYHPEYSGLPGAYVG
jgi:hypothetical protein